MDCFFTTDLQPDATAPRTAVLHGEEAQHCLRVLRHHPGDTVAAVNGQGLYLEGTITDTARDLVTLAVARTVQNWGEPSQETHLLLAPPKHRDRLEWLVEKAVELGVTHLALVHTERTERGHVNTARLHKLMTAALKQCGRSRLPALAVFDFATALHQCAGGLRCLAVVGAASPLPPAPPAQAAAFLVGPEGDFTPAEVAAAQAAGWLPVHLGSTRLRTETAGLYVLAARKAARDSRLA